MIVCLFYNMNINEFLLKKEINNQYLPDWLSCWSPDLSPFQAIDVFMSGCTVFVFLSLMEYALVNIVMGDIADIEKKKSSGLTNLLLGVRAPGLGMAGGIKQQKSFQAMQDLAASQDVSGEHKADSEVERRQQTLNIIPHTCEASSLSPSLPPYRDCQENGLH